MEEKYVIKFLKNKFWGGVGVISLTTHPYLTPNLSSIF